MKQINVLDADLYRIRKCLKERDTSAGYFSMTDDDLVHLALLTFFENMDDDYLHPAYNVLQEREAKLLKRR